MSNLELSVCPYCIVSELVLRLIALIRVRDFSIQTQIMPIFLTSDVLAST